VSSKRQGIATLFRMVKETVTEKWAEARCSECKQKFEYPVNSYYKPETCGKFDCEYKHQHPELSERTK